MSKPTLFEILDGIISSDEGLPAEASADAVQYVQDYAEHGCGRDITADQAREMIRLGNEWLVAREESGEWSRLRDKCEGAVNALDDGKLRYYVIERTYVGPNQRDDRYVDADRIEISTEPARTNQSHEICTDGWCGTTNDWAVYAHGEYATIEAARAAIAEEFGDTRQVEDESGDPDVIETHKSGRFTPCGAEASSVWVCKSCVDIDVNTTDARIEELADELEADMNAEGASLDRDAVVRTLAGMRDRLLEEATESDDE